MILAKEARKISDENSEKIQNENDIKSMIIIENFINEAIEKGFHEITIRHSDIIISNNVKNKLKKLGYKVKNHTNDWSYYYSIKW